MTQSLLDEPIRTAPTVRHSTIEWPTVIALTACHALGVVALGLLGQAAVADGWAAFGLAALGAPLGAYAAALHASLQHEALHGHPTRYAALNEALVFGVPNLFFPYRRFKELHLRHHCDERLTDPYDDPESWYLAERDWTRLSAPMRAALLFNQTLLGRLVVGPWLSAWAMWAGDARDAWRRPERRGKLLDAYARHAIGAGATLAIAWFVFGVGPLLYVLAIAWPGASLLMLRTFAEHEAAERASERSAIVEAEPLFALLFLNNNLHAVHHAHPRAPWYALPKIYARERDATLAANGGYRLNGYREIAARWLLRAKEPVAHPHLRRDSQQ